MVLYPLATAIPEKIISKCLVQHLIVFLNTYYCTFLQTVPLKSDKVLEVHGSACLEILNEKMTQDKTSDPVFVISSIMTPRQLLPILANKPYARRLW